MARIGRRFKRPQGAGRRKDSNMLQPYYGGGWGAQPVFGQTPADTAAAAAAGAGAALAAGAGGMGFGVPNAMLGASCWGDPAMVDPTFRQRHLFSGVLGAQCGPLLQQAPLPFEDVGCIANGEEVDIRAFPQNWGKLVRIVIPRSQASSFVVTGIFIGIQPIFVGQGIVPGEMFEQGAENVLMSTYSYFPNQPVIIRVRNVSGANAFCNPGAIVMCVSGGYPQLYGTPLGGCS
jgi:hypothetical protein